MQDPHTAGKVQVGMPSTEARLSRSQCKLAVTGGPATAEGAENAGSGELGATLQTAHGAKNPVCVRRGNKRKLVQPGESFELRHEDIIEFGTFVGCFECRGRCTRRSLLTFRWPPPRRSVRCVCRSDPASPRNCSRAPPRLPCSPRWEDVWQPSLERIYKYKVAIQTTGAVAPGTATSPGAAATAAAVPPPAVPSPNGPVSTSEEGTDDEAADEAAERAAMPPPLPPGDGVVASSSASSSTYQTKFEVGAVVEVMRRKGAGQNKEGGVARVTRVHPPSHRTGGYESYGVKYLVNGGRESGLLPELLIASGNAGEDKDGADSRTEEDGEDQEGDNHGRSPARRNASRRTTRAAKSPLGGGSTSSSRTNEGGKSGEGGRGSGEDADEDADVDVDTTADEELFFGNSTAPSAQAAAGDTKEGGEGENREAPSSESKPEEAAVLASEEATAPPSTGESTGDQAAPPAVATAASLLGLVFTHKFRGYGIYRGEVSPVVRTDQRMRAPKPLSFFYIGRLDGSRPEDALVSVSVSVF